MNNEWNDLVKEASPSEIEAAKRKQAEAAEKDRYLEKKVEAKSNARIGAWEYERRRFDKLLGWEKVGEETRSTRHATGKEEYVMTSEKTFERREKVDYTFTKYDKMRLDKSKIRDIQSFNKLDVEISEFLSQAEEKFGANIVPALFNNRDCISYGFAGVSKASMVMTELVFAFIGFMTCGFQLGGAILFALGLTIICAAGVILAIYFHRKKHAAYKPMIDAYYNKVKEFEDRIKQITCF